MDDDTAEDPAAPIFAPPPAPVFLRHDANAPRSHEDDLLDWKHPEGHPNYVAPRRAELEFALRAERMEQIATNYHFLVPSAPDFLERARALLTEFMNGHDPLPADDRLWEFDNWDLKKIGQDQMNLVIDDYGDAILNDGLRAGMFALRRIGVFSDRYNVPGERRDLRYGELPSQARRAELRKRARDE